MQVVKRVSMRLLDGGVERIIKKIVLISVLLLLFSPQLFSSSSLGKNPNGINEEKAISQISLELADGDTQIDTVELSGYNPWKLRVNGAFQSDFHYSVASPNLRDHRFMANVYGKLGLYNDYFDFSLRWDELTRPLPGFEEAKGSALSNIYLRGHYVFFDITVGDIYEQFGSGMVLRSYEDRNLGIDNSIRGAHLLLLPYKGISIKFLGGQHRNYFDRKFYAFNKERGFLYCGDLELDFAQCFDKMQENGINILFGSSWVTKHESKQDDIVKNVGGTFYKLKQPSFVNVFASRLRLLYKNWDLYSEYAYKTKDPGAGNNYIFKSGNAAMLTLSYSSRGFSSLLGLRRSDNFDFYSSRSASNTQMRINHLLPFTQQQSYTLAALYPYATHPGGEWSFQLESAYRIPKKSLLGGKYGLSLKFYATHVRGIKKDWLDKAWEQNPKEAEMIGTIGYKSSFFGMGDCYFNNVNLEISKKINSYYNFTVSYFNQVYNQKEIEGIADNGDMVFSNIFVYDGRHKINDKFSFRTELQYLQSRQASRDWLFAMLELYCSKYVIFSISDQWNLGMTNKHYYMTSLAFSYGKHFLQLSYGKTKKGINCSGGVCRLLPATEGLYFSYNVSF